MDTRFVIRLAVPQDKNLWKPQRQLVAAVRDRLSSAGLRVEFDGLDDQGLTERFERMRRSHGVVVMALTQWHSRRLYRKERRTYTGTSEFAHVATSMAVAAGKPLLVLREKDVDPRGAFKEGYVAPVVKVPMKAGSDWLDTATFQDPFSGWLKKVRAQRHVFLGYSSGASAIADSLHRFLVDQLKLKVLDWHDLPTSSVIIGNIATAERLTSAGIFLLTKDDGRRVSRRSTRQAVPRDNVIFEAGYFAGAKGMQSVLIVHEAGATLPSDLGGVVYLDLKKRNDISSIETKVAKFFAGLAGDDETKDDTSS